MSPLKNYTTEISATKSIGEIQGKLIAHGASAIMLNFDAERQPKGLSFIITVKEGELPFRLPANVAAVEKILLEMRARIPETWHSDYAPFMKRIHEQAFRVAWRILRDWVDAQMAIIETEMVTIEQVFLPYFIVGDEKTLYEVMKHKGFYLPEGKG